MQLRINSVFYEKGGKNDKNYKKYGFINVSNIFTF